MTAVLHGPSADVDGVRTQTLTYRPEAGRRARGPGLQRIPSTAIRIAIPVALVVIWQLVGQFGIVSATVLPSPAAILDAYQELWSTGDLQAALPISLQRAGLGLLIGGVAGLVLGVIAGLSVAAERIYDAHCRWCAPSRSSR